MSPILLSVVTCYLLTKPVTAHQILTIEGFFLVLVQTSYDALFTLGFMEEDLISSLLYECIRMSKFNHPNVLNVTGVCMDGGPVPYMVMPYMFNGDLLTYLKKERENLVVPLEAEVDGKTVIKKNSLDDIINLHGFLCTLNY